MKRCTVCNIPLALLDPAEPDDTCEACRLDAEIQHLHSRHTDCIEEARRLLDASDIPGMHRALHEATRVSERSARLLRKLGRLFYGR